VRAGGDLLGQGGEQICRWQAPEQREGKGEGAEGGEGKSNEGKGRERNGRGREGGRRKGREKHECWQERETKGGWQGWSHCKGCGVIMRVRKGGSAGAPRAIRAGGLTCPAQNLCEGSVVIWNEEYAKQC